MSLHNNILVLEHRRIINVASAKAWSVQRAFLNRAEHVGDLWRINFVDGREGTADHVGLDGIVKFGRLVGVCAMLYSH